MSDNPVTGFTYQGVVLENPSIDGRNINTNNNNHQGIIEYEGTWYIFYHDRRLSEQTFFRNISVDLLTHNEDGSIEEVVVTNEGVPQIRHLNPYEQVKAATINKQEGIEVKSCSEGGTMVASISDGDWIRVAGVDFGTGGEGFEARVASGSGGGNIEVRIGSREGRLVGTCTVPETGEWDDWKTVDTEISSVEGVHDLYLVFRGSESDDLFNFNWWKFTP